MKHLFVLLFLIGSGMAANKPATFVGEISDSQCAMNVHSRTRSHGEMLQGHSMGNTADECVRACVRSGGVYVLVTPKKVYKLSDQEKPASFAAKKVKVTGTVDPGSDTIIVQAISAY